MIPVINLKPGQELSADQIVRVANVRLHLLTDDGEKVGFLLKGKIRVLFNDAITVGYLKCEKKQTRLAEVFCCWCPAREIPCAYFEIENDRLHKPRTNDSVEKNAPFVSIHFDLATAGRP